MPYHATIRWIGVWLACSLLNVVAAPPVIRSAAEPDYPPLSTVNAAGRAEGFAVDMLRAALNEVGRDVVFEVAPWATIKRDLADGRLDVLPLVGRTPERKALFDFSIPYLTLRGALFIRDDTTDIKTWSDVRDKRVAVMRADNAEEYVRRVGLSDHIITTERYDQAFRMLSEGEVDAVVAQKLMGISLLRDMGITNVRVTGTPSDEFVQTFCFAVQKNNAPLLNLLNEGLAIVLASGANEHLERQWLGVDKHDAALARVLVYGGDDAFPPYEYLDEKGRPAGFNIDLTRAVARELGVDVVFHLGPWKDIRRQFNRGEFDMASMFYSESRAQSRLFSVPHTAIHQAIFARDGMPAAHQLADLKDQRVAVQYGDFMHDLAVAEDIGAPLITTTQPEEMLALLAAGQADYALGTQRQGLFWIRKNNWTTVRVVEPRLLTTDYCFAVPVSNPALLELLNEALAIVRTSGDYRTIHNRWLGILDSEFSWRQFTHWIVLAIGMAILVVGLGMGSIAFLRRQVRRRTAELLTANQALEASREQALKLRDDAIRARDESQTSLAKAQQSRLALLNVLEDEKSLAAERTQLQNQLHQAQKMEAVGSLAGGVAHDFNNLLMAVMGYAELSLDSIEPDHPIREYLDEILSAAKRSADITHQLLAFARKQTIAPKVLDLNETVGGMLKLLRRLIGEDIQLNFRPGANLQAVSIDPTQIDQILANLCVNARDAMEGPGEISIETANVKLGPNGDADPPDVQPGAYVRLSVSDTGRGMDAQTLAQIFEPFFTTKGIGKGTGLGLSTVYGIVKQNNGVIDVDSEPGHGATFKIYLPQTAQPVASEREEKRDGPHGHGETILLVEDERALRVTCGHFLQQLGYRVLSADSPEAALTLSEREGHAIKVLLTDVVMPGMNGQELARRLCRQYPEIKVLFMSGYTADVVAQRNVLPEGIHFIAKPFSRDDLAFKIREILDPAT